MERVAGVVGGKMLRGGRGGGGQELVTNLLDLVSQHHRLPDGINKYTRTVSQCCQAVVKL